LFKDVEMKYNFKHASKSYQAFRGSGSGLKNKHITYRKSDLGLKIFAKK